MDYSNLSDSEIVELTIKKDKQAYGWLVERYQTKLFAYIFRLTNNKEEASDILQEVFLKTYKNLKGFDKKKKFSSWIYRIAHNESVNWLKKNTKYKKYSIDDDENKINIANENNVEKDLEIDEEKEFLIKRLNSLPIKYKEVLILKYIEEKSYQEIAEILKKSKNAVGISINRAKKNLAEMYEINEEK